MGRPGIWLGPIGRDLLFDVNAALKAKGLSRSEPNAVREVCARLTGKGRWKGRSAETLRKGFYKARGHYGDKPKPPRRKAPGPIELALVDAWLAWIGRQRSIPDRRRVTRDKAFMVVAFVLTEIKNGNWPPASGEALEQLKQFVQHPETLEPLRQFVRTAEAFLKQVDSSPPPSSVKEVEKLKQLARDIGKGSK
jgi:hypothetical protein